MRRFLPFDRYFAPESLEEALTLLRDQGANDRVLAGGTDIIVAMREKGLRADSLIDIKRVPELRGIELAPRGGLSVGATTTLHEVERNAYVKQICPILVQAVQTIGSLQVRNLGTLGGNLANASPAADSATALLVLDAEMELVSAAGMRCLPVDKFFVGPGRTVLREGEILRRVLIPPPRQKASATYIKFGPRNAMDIGIVSVAVSLVLVGEQVCEHARVALGATGPTPFRARRTEALLEGELVEGRIEQAAKEAAAEAQPIDDIRASADYRRTLVQVLVKRAIQQAINQHRAATAEAA